MPMLTILNCKQASATLQAFLVLGESEGGGKVAVRLCGRLRQWVVVVVVVVVVWKFTEAVANMTEPMLRKIVRLRDAAPPIAGKLL